MLAPCSGAVDDVVAFWCRREPGVAARVGNSAWLEKRRIQHPLHLDAP